MVSQKWKRRVAGQLSSTGPRRSFSPPVENKLPSNTLRCKKVLLPGTCGALYVKQDGSTDIGRGADVAQERSTSSQDVYYLAATVRRGDALFPREIAVCHAEGAASGHTFTPRTDTRRPGELA